MQDDTKFRRRPTLDLSDREILNLVNRCEERERRARDQIEVIESMLNMELDSAKLHMKRANQQGDARNFEYHYGQVSGIGTALCCLRKAMDMDDSLLQSQEIIFFPMGRCTADIPFAEAMSSNYMSLGNIVWTIYENLLSHKIEPIPSTVYEAFYECALDKGYPTELYIKSISQKPEKTTEDRKILRTAVTCEDIATQGERWHGEYLTDLYIRRGIWHK